MQSFFRKLALPSVIIAILFVPFSVFANESRFFTDVDSSDILYTPHINRMLEQKLVNGYTSNGVFSGLFGPGDTIDRAAFVKMAVTVRIAEEIGNGGWLGKSWSKYTTEEAQEAIDKKLTPFYNCSDYPAVCDSIGHSEFLDVPAKDSQCDSKEFRSTHACEPWFGQYVYYSVDEGFIKGYSSGSGRVFNPGDPILRIHALKIILANDGNIAPLNDKRFTDLIKLAEDRLSYSPKCLNGAENTILSNNGGNNADAQKLLQYAILADRLDLFGNSCQAFDSVDRQQRADWLQEPLKREEAARWFAISSYYKDLNPDPTSDLTINDAIQNDLSSSNDPNYEWPEYIPNDSTASDTSKPPVNCPVGDPSCNTTEDQNNSDGGTADDGDQASGGGPTINPDSIQEYINNRIKDSKQGRCCKNSNYSDPSLCSIVQFASCSISPDFVTTYEQVGGIKTGELWFPADCSNSTYSSCWIPQGDINKGYSQIQLNQDVEANQIEERQKLNQQNVEEDFRIDKVYVAMESEHYGEGKIIPFKIIKTDEGVNSHYSDAKKDTYILIHGYKSSSSAWAESMADAITYSYRNKLIKPQILLVDWEIIADQLLFEYVDQSSHWIFRIGNLLKLFNLKELPNQVSEWIMPMINEIKYPLIKWGIENKKTTIIGHSLGSFFAHRLADELERRDDIQSRGIVNRIVLEPAAGFNYSLDDDQLVQMTDFNESGACFVVDGSLSGSEKLTKTCKEKYMIKYNEPHGDSFLYQFTENVKMNFVVGEVADLPLKSIKEGTLRSVLKAGNQQLIVSVEAEKLDGQKIVLGTAAGYVVGAGADWSCGPLMATPTIGVVVHKACSAVVETAVSDIFTSVKMALIDKHNWAHRTYDQMIQTPFYNNYLTPQDVFSRIHDWNSKFLPGVYKGVDGVIFTERNQPRKIKYLKVIDPQKSQYHTLYGNSQSNEFECKDNIDCFVYGGASNDTFLMDRDSRDYYVEDFKRNDADKIVINKGESNNALTHLSVYEVKTPYGTRILLESNCGDCILDERQKLIVFRNIFLKEIDLKSVSEWADRAVYPEKYLPSQIRINPILIQ